MGKVKQNQIKAKQRKACSWTRPWDASNENVFISKKKKNSIFCRYTVFPFAATKKKQKGTMACFRRRRLLFLKS